MTRFPIQFSFLIIFMAFSCKKDQSDTSLGIPVNQIRQLEVSIDGIPWETDNVFTETLYGNLHIVGDYNENRIEVKLRDFNGPGIYTIDNDNSYIKFYEDVADQSNFYFSLNDTVVVTSYIGEGPILIGSFSFTGTNVNGEPTKEFTNGLFNGIDSISNVPFDILNVLIDQEPWISKSVEVTENTNFGTLTMLAQDGASTNLIIRIPTTSNAGTYDLIDPNFTVEYHVIDGETFTANSGQLEITENDFFNFIFTGSLKDLTLTEATSSNSIYLNGNFNLHYE